MGSTPSESQRPEPSIATTGELFSPGYLCMTTARAKIEAAFGGTPDARIAVNPLQALENKVAKILEPNGLQDDNGYILTGKLLQKLQLATGEIFRCVNSPAFGAYFSEMENPREFALKVYRDALEDVVVGFNIDADFMQWFDFYAQEQVVEAAARDSSPNLCALEAPAPSARRYAVTQPIGLTEIAREASGNYLNDELRASMKPPRVPVVHDDFDEDTIVDYGNELPEPAKEYLEAMIQRVFFNPEAPLIDSFVQFVATASEDALKVDAESKGKYITGLLEQQAFDEKPSSLPVGLTKTLRQGAIGGIETVITELIMRECLKLREKNRRNGGSTSAVSVPELHLVDVPDNMQAAVEGKLPELHEVPISEDVKVAEEVNPYETQVKDPEPNEEVFALDYDEDEDTPTVDALTPAIENGEAELSEDEFAAVMADAGIVMAPAAPDVSVGSVEMDASELDGIDGADNEVTLVFKPVGRYAMSKTETVTVADGVEAKKVEGSAQLRKVDLGAQVDLPTIPPAKLQTVSSEKMVPTEQKRSLLGKLKQNSAVRKGFGALAAASLMIAGAVGFGLGVSEKNSTTDTSESANTTTAPTAKAQNGTKSSDVVTPEKNVHPEDDIEFEEGAAYEINAKALEGSKLLAKTIRDNGFKRSESYNGDFSELNFRLTDNATPQQMVKVKEVYQKYQSGQYKVSNDPNGTSAPGARAFYMESVNGFSEAGVGASQQDGKWNINRKGGETGSFVRITDAQGNYIPFVKEVLIARGVLVEKDISSPATNVDTPVNVPINYEIEQDETVTPSSPAEVIHTMNHHVDDVLTADDIISDEPEVTIGETELSASELAELEMLEIDAGWDDVVPEQNGSLLKGYCQKSEEVDAGWDDVAPAKNGNTLLAGYSEDSSDVDSDWV